MSDSTGCYQHCIETFTGMMFDVVNPRPEDVRIDDIAHALSLLNRFNGHTRLPYSVAEHSVHVCSDVVGDVELRLAALLHDAAEAYTGDMTRPLKLHNPDFCRMQERIEATIWKAFDVDLTPTMEAIIKVADNAVLRAEAETLGRRLQAAPI